MADILFFEDKPLFGLDLTTSKARVVQLDTAGRRIPAITGYGETSFDETAIHEGIVEKPEILAQAIQELFSHHLVGAITTRRVALSLPIARAFTRTIEIPDLNDTELAEAIQNESAQYIPAALEDLYIDYTRVGAKDGHHSAFIVAMPRKIVDSYVTLTRLLGLEAVILQTASGANAHLFSKDKQSDVPTVLIDLADESADITVYDNGPVVSGTVAAGSDQVIQAIARELHVTRKEAELIKTKYGLSYSKKQAQIRSALNPTLSLLIKEIKRTIRYFEEHAAGKRIIAQVVITGESANMPGLAEHLTDSLRLAVRVLDPSPYIEFGHLQPFNPNDRMSYATAVGLASIDPKQVFV